MTSRESVPLSSLTTLRVGGTAQLVAECSSLDDIKAAIALARHRGLSWYVLGGGSNVLAADEGYEGIIIRMKEENTTTAISIHEEGTVTLCVVTAGVDWNYFVDWCCAQGLWSVENLAGIPGTVGAAPVQNIGAYGVEVGEVIEWVEAFDANTSQVIRLNNDACEFAYRDSVFKRNRALIIARVAFRLAKKAEPRIEYADIAKRRAEGAALSTPNDIATVVRTIRAQKFPDLTQCGTAGSFFKNPVISEEEYSALKKKYPDLPGYFAPHGIKVSLAWILDNVLHLKGYGEGRVRLFEKQPLVLVVEEGATTNEIILFANKITEKVFDATKIKIEREVQSVR